MRNSKPILLVEDDDVDAMTTKRALNEINVTNELIHRVDGEDGLDYLRQNIAHKPCVILLDLNMPRMNGFEFLKHIKENETFKKIPVVVLTTSDADQNIVESFELGVAGYITKPVDYKQFVDAIRTVNMYWTLSMLPNGD